MNILQAMHVRCRNSRRQGGFAVFVVLALLAILLTYMSFNLTTVRSLERNVKLLEHRQVQRLNHITIATNSIPWSHDLPGGPGSLRR